MIKEILEEHEREFYKCLIETIKVKDNYICEFLEATSESIYVENQGYVEFNGRLKYDFKHYTKKPNEIFHSIYKIDYDLFERLGIDENTSYDEFKEKIIKEFNIETK